LQICSTLSQHITQIQLSSQNSNSSSENSDSNDLSENTTREGLQECKESLAATAARLEKNMQDIMDRLLASSRKNLGSQEDIADLTRLRDEWETTRECMNICSKAENHLKEDVTVVENYGRGDALQFMVSTNGKILHGKNQGFGWRTRQIGGYLNDASLQKLCSDMTNPHFRVVEQEGSFIQDDPKSTTVGQKRAVTAEYKERYGQGYKLTSQPSSSDFKATSSTNTGPSRSQEI
jgi:alkylated DNA nucleotide flippase Atl1